MAGNRRGRGLQGGEGMTRNGIHLTDREMDVLRRTARGDGAAKIARDLNIGRDRVKTLRQSIKTKVGLDRESTVDHMVARALRLGFIS